MFKTNLISRTSNSILSQAVVSRYCQFRPQRFKRSRVRYIYIPSLKAAIEYDSFYYHNDNKRAEFDDKKNKLCEENEIRLIRIREGGLPPITDTDFIKIIATKVYTHSQESKKELEKVIQDVLLLLSTECDIQIERDELYIYSMFLTEETEGSLSVMFPAIAAEWHPSKNASLLPSNVKAKSALKVWWICKNGHEWQATIGSRTGKQQNGCPYCSGRRLLNGTNDLLTCFPDIASEWHPTLNGDLKPSQVTKSSNKKVWWKGSKCGHEWIATVGNRTGGNKTKCPYCSNEKILSGFNDLKTLFPSIASEWHPTLNEDLRPENVMGGTVKKVWWLCKKGHAYQASPHNRTNSKTGCPYCSHRKLCVGKNDLQTCFPEIAQEWHPTLNWELTPSGIAKSSNKKVWWKCKRYGHEWRATVNSRTGKVKAGCPICFGRKKTN